MKTNMTFQFLYHLRFSIPSQESKMESTLQILRSAIKDLHLVL